MSALTAPQREPIEADPPAEEPRRETGGDGAPVEASTFARMDAGQRLAHLRSLLAVSANANPAAAEQWRRRNAPQAEPAPNVEPPAPAAPANNKTASSTPRRVVKTLLGLALVAAVGYEPLQRMAQTSSVEAIVNARVITLRAPIEGEVQPGPAAREAGAALAPGELLFRVVDKRADRGRVDDLSRQLAQARDERPRLAARLESARGLLADLTEQTRQFREARIRQLEARRDALTADAAAAHARSFDAAATVARANWLTAQGAGTTVQANQAKRDADVAAQNEIAAQRQIAVNDVELEAARRGVFVGDSYNDRPTSAQRADDLGQQIVDFEQALDESDRRVARLSQDVADEQARYAELSSAAIVAPAKGSVWEVLTASGEQVQARPGTGARARLRRRAGHRDGRRERLRPPARRLAGALPTARRRRRPRRNRRQPHRRVDDAGEFRHRAIGDGARRLSRHRVGSRARRRTRLRCRPHRARDLRRRPADLMDALRPELW